MSIERWVKITTDATDKVQFRDDAIDFACEVADSYRNAEGQRVEAIRWCETHGTSACSHAAWRTPLCSIVDATLILTPKEQA